MSNLIGNPETRFSRVAAQIIAYKEESAHQSLNTDFVQVGKIVIDCFGNVCTELNNSNCLFATYM